jgi:hypothetical protein
VCVGVGSGVRRRKGQRSKRRQPTCFYVCTLSVAMITRNILKKNVENMANLEENLDNRTSNTVWQETVWDHPTHNPIPNIFLV